MSASRHKSWNPVLCTAIGTILILIAAALPVGSQEWHPAWPEKDNKDWVQLKSGEWVRGNMDLFRDLKMEFDSDELDDLKIDWEDIVAFRMPREMTFVFEGQVIYAGSASMRDGVIRINTDDGVKDLPRGELLTIIEGKPRERNFWSTQASIGYTQRSGNTEQIDLATRIYIKREATRSRTSLEFRSNISEVQSTETVNDHKGNLLLDMFVSRMFYITAFSYEYYSNKFQNIDYRNTVGAGVGYFLFRQPRIDWSVGIGAGYQVTQFLSVDEGEDTEQKSGSIIPTLNLDWDITKDIEWQLEYSSQIGVPDIKTSTHHATTYLSIDFWKDIFELTFSITWDRVDNPQAFEDGTIPKKDDIKMVFGFGIDI
jgi:putative salt-induced outer membrane protein YdiY